MKKIFVFLTVIALAVPVFAQNDGKDWTGNRRTAVYADPTLFLVGPLFGVMGGAAGVEVASLKSFSLCTRIFYVSSISWEDIDAHILYTSLEARWYPERNYVQGFFLSGGLQYHLFSAEYGFSDGEIEPGASYHAFGFLGGVGYKFVFGKKQFGFFLEPSLYYAWPIKTNIPFDETDKYSGNVMAMMLGIKFARPSLIFGLAF
jgi:hypothetical protein